MEKNKKETIRSFIAIELEEDIRNKLCDITSEIKEMDNKIRWVKKESLHLTLKFLGDITAKKQKKIENILSEIGLSTHSFIISLIGLGAFPNFSRPHVLWAGVMKGADHITNLVSEINKALHSEGFEREKRKYVPHITLARIKAIKDKDSFKEKVLQNKETFFAEQAVPMISLMKSELTPQGAIYTTLKEIPLEKANNS